MNKTQLKLLESAWDAEIGEALDGTIGILQSKSKVAEKLADQGFLVRSAYLMTGRMTVTIRGYRLTHLGRMTYCATCKERE